MGEAESEKLPGRLLEEGEFEMAISKEDGDAAPALAKLMLLAGCG